MSKRRIAPDGEYVVRINLHWRADNQVTMYMNGRKSMTGDHQSIRHCADRLVSEGKAVMGRTAFTFAKGEEK